MRNDKPRVSCTECGFEWFGPTAAHALRMVGICTHCRGELRFHDVDALPEPGLEPSADVPAHLVLGAPRI
ncbi:MAG TPA: hypothetical protein VD790_09825 [Thermoleophilaceae bacterium]|nr:hypothetical protein [Thermoleophilaceae bacterium]